MSSVCPLYPCGLAQGKKQIWSHDGEERKNGRWSIWNCMKLSLNNSYHFTAEQKPAHYKGRNDGKLIVFQHFYHRMEMASKFLVKITY